MFRIPPKQKRLRSHIYLTIVCSLILVAVFSPTLTSAQWYNPASWGGAVLNTGFSVVARAIFFVAWLANTIIGFAVVFAAWLLEVFLAISTGVVQSPTVQKGFTVSLSIANLGFIVAIIVMAIATILRRESYGMKQSLAKLVVAAILVNFSLVITGSILAFADNIGLYFLNGVSGSSGAFASQVAGAFDPQRNTLILDRPLDTTTALTTFDNNENGLSSISKSVTTLAFTIIGGLIIIITLLTLVIMLLVRYVALGILLVLMPLVWVAWIFQGTRSYWSRWWSQFFRWTFFLPIVLFFLWLAVLTSTSINDPSQGIGQALNDSVTAPTGIWAAIKKYMTDAFAGTIQSIFQTVLVVGLMIGGMLAANNLGIHGASIAVGAFKSGGNAIKGWAGRRGKQLVTSPLRREGARETAEKVQQVGETWRQTEGRGVRARFKRFVGAVGGYPVRLAGRGLESTAVSGDKLVDQAKKDHGGKSGQQLANNISTMTAPQRIAAFEKLLGDKDLGLIKQLSTTHLTSDQRDLFKRYGKEKLFNDLNTAIGSPPEARELNKQILEAKKSARTVDKTATLGTANASVNALELQGALWKEMAELEDVAKTRKLKGEDASLEEKGLEDRYKLLYEIERDVDAHVNRTVAAKDANGNPVDVSDRMKTLMDEHFAKYSKKDAEKFHANEIWSNQAQFGMSREEMRQLADYISYGIASKAPYLTSSIMSKMKGERLENFVGSYTKAIKSEMAKLNRTDPRENDKYEKLEDVLSKLKKSIENNTLFVGGGEPSTQAAPAP